MISIEFIFLGIGLISIAGYFSVWLFKKTKISETIILLLVGLLIGPISNLLNLGVFGKNELSLLEYFLPFFAGLALVMILFEGGMKLSFFKTIKSLPEVLSFTLAVFITNIIFTILIFWFFGILNLIQFNIFLAIFLGAVFGGTGSAVIIPLIVKTSAKEETKSLLSLEAALTSALCIIVAVAVAELFIVGEFNITLFITNLTTSISIALMIGFVSGISWLKLLSILNEKTHAYLVTISALLFVYSITQFFNGNGAIAVLIFGIILGNGTDITNMLRLTKRQVDNTIRTFQNEFTFLVKTFFFVYLGIIFKLEYLTLKIIFISIIIIFGIFLSRYIISILLKKIKPIFSQDQKLISFMCGRGLAAAVLVSLPISLNLDKINPLIFTNELMGELTAISFIIIFGTNLLTTLGIFIFENKKIQLPPKEENETIFTKLKINTKDKTLQ
jgi:potassium/hydrogen antiporter